jgi:hypothetical protein
MSATPNLARKLAEIIQAVKGVEKLGRNEQQGYGYVRATDILTAVRTELAKRQVVLTTSVETQAPLILERGGRAPAVIYQVTGTFTLVDGESGESLTFTMPGAGSDYGGEKGLYKAITGMTKYALKTLFLLADEIDDPEYEPAQDEPAAQRPRAIGAPEDAPAEHRRPTPASPKQINLIKARAREAGFEPGSDAWRGFLAAVTGGKQSTSELAMDDVDRVLAAFDKPDLVDLFLGAKIAEPNDADGKF